MKSNQIEWIERIESIKALVDRIESILEINGDAPP